MNAHTPLPSSRYGSPDAYSDEFHGQPAGDCDYCQARDGDPCLVIHKNGGVSVATVCAECEKELNSATGAGE